MPALKLALEYIVPCMNKHGICVVDDFLGRETGQQIGDEVRALHDTGKFTDGQLVSQKSDSSKDIRGDQITWIEGKEPGCETIGLLMSSMDDLIRHCSGKLGNYRINGRTKVSGWGSCDRRRVCEDHPPPPQTRGPALCLSVAPFVLVLSATVHSAEPAGALVTRGGRWGTSYTGSG